MVWVYDRTGSLFVTMLMRVSLTTSIQILGPLANIQAWIGSIPTRLTTITVPLVNNLPWGTPGDRR